MREVRTLWLMGLAVGLCGCPPERLFPDQVAMGVARLTARNAGNLVNIIENDTRCGFKSEDGKRAVLEGEVGGPGKATWTVTNCDLDFGAPITVSEDCKGNKTEAAGRAVVTVTKTVEGILTGNPENPVAPQRPDAARFDVQATFHGFVVRTSNSNAYLTIQTGGLDFTVEPHLAVSASLQVCSIPTGDVTISNIKYDNAVVEVSNAGRKFVVDVPSSDYLAQVGKWGDRENELDGDIQVWQHPFKIPVWNDTQGLDPEYKPQTHLESFECTTDMALPVSYECPSLKPRLAEGAARLTVASFGNIVSIVDADTSCGFSSAAVASSPSITGELGVDGGEAVFTIGSPCTIQFPAGAVVSEDCHGVQTIVQGSVTVTGTKTLRGVRSGDPAAPIVPTTRDPAEISLQVTFNGFRLSDSETSNALSVQGGTLSGTVRPRVARDIALGACALPTTVVSFSGLTWQDGDLLLQSEGNSFKLHVDASSLDAQSGNKDGVANRLEGTMTLDGEVFTVPTSGNVLDPNYDEERFLASFSCDPNMEIPADDAGCSLRPTLMDGSGRLSIATFGTLVSIVDANTSCGFASAGVVDSVQVNGVTGYRGADATYTITTPCTLSFPEKTLVSQDCNGVSTFVQGTAVVTGRKILRGIATGDPHEPIVPTSRDPAEITLAADLTDFTVTMTDSENSMTVIQGQMSGTLKPRVALDQETGACSIATPVVEFNDVLLGNAQLWVNSGEKRFRFSVDSAELNAQNGSKGNRTNWLSGTMTAQGETAPVPRDQSKQVLNPEYDADTFNRSFSCAPHFKLPASDAECSFHRTLAENTARLTIQHAGAVATMVNTSTDCGFENYFVLLAPDNVVGDAGEQGSMTWSVEECQVGFVPEELWQHDCNGGDMWVGGLATVNATRTVTGLREKMLVFVDSIRPDSRDDVTIRLDSAVLEEFHADYYEPDTGEPLGTLVYHEGAMSGTIYPILGERLSDRGLYDVAVPIAVGVSRLDDITVRNAQATLQSEGKTFHFRVDELRIDAFNGSYRDDSNWLSGYVVVDGTRVDFENISLNPHFNQATFDSGYACVDDLVGVIPVNE